MIELNNLQEFSIVYKDKTIIFFQVYNKKLKHSYLQFNNKHQLIIKTPIKNVGYAEKLILSKIDWILKTKKKLLEIKNKNLMNLTSFKQDITPKYIWFLGKKIKLIEQSSNFSTYISLNNINNETAIFYKNNITKVDFITCLKLFYKEKSSKLFVDKIKYYSNLMNVKPNNISIKATKRQWGSCSYNNNISLSLYLMAVPEIAIDYVIVHELCHIVHKNHSSNFWYLLESYIENYKVIKKILRNVDGNIFS